MYWGIFKNFALKGKIWPCQGWKIAQIRIWTNFFDLNGHILPEHQNFENPLLCKLCRYHPNLSPTQKLEYLGHPVPR